MGQHIPGILPNQASRGSDSPQIRQAVGGDTQSSPSGGLSPYYVLLDANIWVSERLLQSSIGSAFLYAVAGAQSSIVLPEVIELELSRVLPKMAEDAVGDIKSAFSLLRQLSGQDLPMITAPSTSAIEEGIQHRWKQLGGLLVRLPFTLDQAKSALSRVIRKAPPSGENNEQFRDSCIWDAAMLMATERTVHLVTADNAFYDQRNKAAGLARVLHSEMTATMNGIRIYPSLKEFLASMGASAAKLDEQVIGDAILNAVLEPAREIATREGNPVMSGGATFELGAAHQPEIRGYATPKPSLVAISFEVSFELDRTTVAGEAETLGPAKMTLKGVCSYDPITKKVSEIEIRAWSKESRWGGTGWTMTSSPDREAVERQYAAGKIRVIS